jgi:hypothetical protein
VSTAAIPLRSASEQARALVEAIYDLQDGLPACVLEARIVQHVERLVDGSAAALFRCEAGEDVLTRRAAGPRWRTAEQDTPAWLARDTLALARLVRTATPMVAEIVCGGSVPSDAQVRELVQVPLTVDGLWWGTLVVLRPPGAVRRATDVWLVRTCAGVLETALAACQRPLAASVR